MREDSGTLGKEKRRNESTFCLCPSPFSDPQTLSRPYVTRNLHVFHAAWQKTYPPPQWQSWSATSTRQSTYSCRVSPSAQGRRKVHTQHNAMEGECTARAQTRNGSWIRSLTLTLTAYPPKDDHPLLPVLFGPFGSRFGAEGPFDGGAAGVLVEVLGGDWDRGHCVWDAEYHRETCKHCTNGCNLPR